jgi:hypothetical protein
VGSQCNVQAEAEAEGRGQSIKYSRINLNTVGKARRITSNLKDE